MFKSFKFLLIPVFALPLIPSSGYSMHIAEGLLPSNWALFWWLLAIGFLVISLKSIKKITLEKPKIKILLALSSAFIFVLSSLKLPSVTGSSSHPTGVGLGAILFGPKPMISLGAIALLLQTLLLAHGGLTTLGANIISMALVGPIVAYGIFKLSEKLIKSRSTAIFLGSALGDLITYATTSMQLALAFPSETGGFAESFLKFMAIFAITQIPIAIVEGILTVFVVNLLIQHNEPELKEIHFFKEKELKLTQPFFKMSNKVALIIFIGFIMAVPLIILASNQFQGSDDQAVQTITQLTDNYKPWFESIWKPSLTIENFSFIGIAVLGLGYIGYFFGISKKQNKSKKKR